MVLQMSVRERVGHVFRGAAIGVAEAVPGVSGGTIALVTGVYERLIASAGHLISAVRYAVTDVPRKQGWARSREQFRQVHWGVIIPLALGMLPGLLLAARLLEPMLEEHPEQTRGLFFGLVLASVLVPVSMIGRPWRGRDVFAVVAAGVAAFVLTGLPSASIDPNPVVVLLAAAVAVCALVLPGVSGSFLLLTVGLYEPTIEAVNDRDFGYLAVFAVGMLVGLTLFVKLLQYLLEHHRRVTLAVMTGVIVGSLRALWPWQTEERGLLAPDGNVLSVVLLLVLGVAIVTAMVVLEQRRLRRAAVDVTQEESPQLPTHH
ncbi:putative membrane protein [Micromonospora sp. Llam0]|nr:putative membrane protein [Micromonospora sp. Llam0]